jgi:hypothetical protein
MVIELISFIFCRIWIGSFNRPDDPFNWIDGGNFADLSDFDMYTTSFYFCVATIVTVGYGDISPTPSNPFETIFIICLMICGAFSMSFATGTFSSIISNFDSSQAKLKEKISTLNEIRKQYDISNDLYEQLRIAIKYDNSKNYSDVINFMEELPYKLKVDLAL